MRSPRMVLSKNCRPGRWFGLILWTPVLARRGSNSGNPCLGWRSLASVGDACSRAPPNG